MKNLADILREWRWAKRISVRLAARIIGLSASTLSRVERGEECDSKTLSKILKWILT